MADSNSGGPPGHYHNYYNSNRGGPKTTTNYSCKTTNYTIMVDQYWCSKKGSSEHLNSEYVSVFQGQFDNDLNRGTCQKYQASSSGKISFRLTI